MKTFLMQIYSVEYHLNINYSLIFFFIKLLKDPEKISLDLIELLKLVKMVNLIFKFRKGLIEKLALEKE